MQHPHSSATLKTFAEWLGDRNGHYLDNWRPTRRQVASWSKQNGLLIDRRWSVEAYERTGETASDVTKIAIDLQRVYENVLVVAPRRDSAEKYAGLLANAVSRLNRPFISGQEANKLRRLAEKIRQGNTSEGKACRLRAAGCSFSSC